MRTHPRSRPRRLLRLAGVLAVLAAVGAAVWSEAGHADETAAPTTTAPLLDTAEVAEGDLVTSQRVDGTVDELGGRTVVHRIEGQSSSGATNGGSSSTGSSGGSTVPAGAAPSASGQTETLASAAAAQTESLVAAAAAAPADTSDTTATTAPADTTATAPSDTTATSPSDTTATTIPATPSAGGAGVAPTGGGAPTGAAPSGSTGGTIGGSGSGSSTSVSTSSSTRFTQLVTWVAPVGTTIGSGDPIYTVEGSPVVAMYGTLPAWRSLRSGVDDGADVLQLEQNLVALGADPDREITIDEAFDDDTEAAIERWQAELGVDVTGEITLGQVVFVPSQTEIRSVIASAGDEVGDGDGIVELAGTSLEVVIEVPDELESALAPGTAVTVGDVPATVTLLRSAEADDGSVTVQAVIEPSGQVGETGSLDARPGDVVTVQLDVTLASDVLVVPSEALVSKIDGTLTVQTDDGVFVTVELVAVTGGRAGIRSDELAAGDQVLVPA